MEDIDEEELIATRDMNVDVDDFVEDEFADVFSIDEKTEEYIASLQEADQKFGQPLLDEKAGVDNSLFRHQLQEAGHTFEQPLKSEEKTRIDNNELHHRQMESIEHSDHKDDDKIIPKCYFPDPLDEFIFDRDRAYRIVETKLKNSGKGLAVVRAELKQLFPTVADEIQIFTALRSNDVSSDEIESALVMKYPHLAPVIEQYKKNGLMHSFIATTLKNEMNISDIEHAVKTKYPDVSPEFIQSIPSRIDHILEEGSYDDEESDIDSDISFEDDDFLSGLLDSGDDESIDSDILDGLLDD